MKQVVQDVFSRLVSVMIIAKQQLSKQVSNKYAMGVFPVLWSDPRLYTWKPKPAEES
jgi:hypothetical protein